MITRFPEWEGTDLRLVRVDGLSRGVAFPKGVSQYPPWGMASYYRVPGRRVSQIHVHQAYSKPSLGLSACQVLADWHAKQQHPAQPHTFVLPTQLDVVDGKFEVYRCWDDDWVTQHTRPSVDGVAVSVCLVGTYASRHAHDDFGGNPYPEPDPAVTEALVALIDDYLLPRYALSWSDVYGGFDTGTPADPGDAIESVIRNKRGEHWVVGPPADTPLSDKPLRTFDQRRAALHELGYVTESAGLDWRAAVAKYQKDKAWLTVTGVWDAQTERAVRIDLLRG